MIWLWLWLGGCITFLVPTARFLLDEHSFGDDPETFDYVTAIALAICIVPFWPLFIPGYYVYWMLKRGEAS